MESKKWFQSRTIWVGIVAVLIAAYNTACSQFGLPAIPEFVYGLLGALGIYSRATTNTVIK